MTSDLLDSYCDCARVPAPPQSTTVAVRRRPSNTLLDSERKSSNVTTPSSLKIRSLYLAAEARVKCRDGTIHYPHSLNRELRFSQFAKVP